MDENYKNTLIWVVSRLNNIHVRYAIAGSGNLAIHGMDTSPRDIDIVILEQDIVRVADAFCEFLPKDVHKFSPSGLPIKGVSILMNNVEIEMLSDDTTEGFYSRRLLNNEIEKISWCGIFITALTLAAEADSYSATGRIEKATTIYNYLNNRPS